MGFKKQSISHLGSHLELLNLFIIGRLIIMYSNQTSSSYFLRETSYSKSSPTKDPYNYALNDEMSRNSMINKLPGKKDIDLGEAPEVVILFQAAQIERLSTIVSSQRLLSKGKSKQNLDRHSYQIQIKQLSLIIEGQKEQKRGLERRIQDMNKMVNEFQERAENNRDSSALANKYERALLEIGKMYDDNTKLQDEINILNWQMSQLKKETQIKKDQDVIRQVQDRESEIKRLQEQIANLEFKNSQTVVQLRQSFSRQIEEYQIRMDEKNILKKEELEEELSKALNRINKLNSQIEEENNSKWELESKIRNYEIKERQWEAKLRNSQFNGQKLAEQVNRLNQKVATLEKFNSPNAFNSLTYSLSQNNKNSLLREPSVNSSFSHHNRGQSQSQRTNQQLENNVALLSQELERLTELIKNKNTEIECLEGKLSESWSQSQKQIMEIKSKFERDLRRQAQQADQERERRSKELERFRGRIRELQENQSQNTKSLDIQFIKIKQEERKICEAVYNRKVQTLELQYGRDRDQLKRLRRQLDQLSEQLDSLKTETDKRVKELREKNKEENEKMVRQAQQQAQFLREKQIENIQRVRNITQQYENNLKIMQREKETKIDSLRREWKEKQSQMINSLREKEDQMARINDQVRFQEGQKWEQAMRQCEKLRHSNRVLQLTLEQLQDQHGQLQIQSSQLESTRKAMVNQYKNEIQRLESELRSKEELVREYSVKLTGQNREQNEQISRMTQIIEMKSRQLLELSNVVGQYQERYDGLRDQFKGMEEVVGKVLQDREADFNCIDKLELENAELKRELKKNGQQLQLERNQKSKIIQKSREQLAKLIQQLLSQVPTPPLIPFQDFSQTTKLLSLQADFTRLEQVIRRLKKDNYLLTRHNYDGDTQQHVSKEFTHTKIVELNKEIERLIQENIELKDEIQRCRLQFVGQINWQIRYEENLGAMMLLFLEIESLRARIVKQGLTRQF